jgi:predicted DNA repair protein MutK
MASGLIALLDDMAAIAKVAASSIDDVVVQATKAGTKAAGIVIDDAAVTPRYVVGFASDRELPIIWKIALGSLKNKLLFLLPAALLLSTLAPWAITPLLMAGGVYLCFEGYEKLHSLVVPHDAHHDDPAGAEATSAEALEAQKVSGAIRTDFILSAEIMAITLSTVADQDLAMRAVVLAAVGIGITIAVYGVVALIVKADDAGAAMARSERPFTAIGWVFGGRPEPANLPAPSPFDRMLSPITQPFGRGLVRFMPVLLSALSLIGTAAMLWVGGDIILHGLAGYGLAGPEHLVKDLAKAAGESAPALGGVVTWVVGALFSAIAGTAIGAAAAPVVTYVIAPLMKRLPRRSARQSA